MSVTKTFFFLGITALLGGAYFSLQLITGTPNAGEIIVLPIYIGFAVAISAVCFVVALVAYVVRRRK